MQSKKTRKRGLVSKKKYNLGGSVECPNPPCPPNDKSRTPSDILLGSGAWELTPENQLVRRDATEVAMPSLSDRARLLPGLYPTDQGTIRQEPSGVPPNAAWMYQAMPAFQDKGGMAAAAKWTEKNPLSSPQGLNMMGMLNSLGTRALGLPIPGTAIGGLQGSELTLGHIFNAYLLNEGAEGFKRHVPEFFNDPSWEGLKNLGIDALQVLPASSALYSNVVRPAREVIRSGRSYFAGDKPAETLDIPFQFVDDVVDPVKGALNQLKTTVQKPMSVITRPPSLFSVAQARQRAVDDILDSYAVAGGLQTSVTLNRHSMDELDDIARAYAAKKNLDFETARSSILDDIEKQTSKHYEEVLRNLPGSLIGRPYDTRYPEGGNRIRMRFLNPNSKLWQQASKDGMISLTPLSKSLSSNDLSDLEKIVLKESIFASPVFNKSGQPLEGEELAKAREDITAFLNGDISQKAVNGYRLNLNFLKGSSEQSTFIQDPIYTMELDPESTETYFGLGLQGRPYGRSYTVDKKVPSVTYQTYGLGRLGVNYENPTTYIVGTDYHASYMSHFKRGEMAHFRTFDQPDGNLLPNAINGRDILEGYNLYGRARINGELTDVGRIPMLPQGEDVVRIFHSPKETPVFSIVGGVGSITTENFDASNRLFERFVNDASLFKQSGIFNLKAESTLAPEEIASRGSREVFQLHGIQPLLDLGTFLSDLEDMVELTISQAVEFADFSADYWNNGKSSITNTSKALKTFEPGGSTGKYVAEAVEAYEQGLINESQKNILIDNFNIIDRLIRLEKQLLSIGGSIDRFDEWTIQEKMLELHPEFNGLSDSQLAGKIKFSSQLAMHYSRNDLYSDFTRRYNKPLSKLFTDMGYDFFKIDLSKPVNLQDRWLGLDSNILGMKQYMDQAYQDLAPNRADPSKNDRRLLDLDHLAFGPYDKTLLENLNKSQRNYALRMSMHLSAAFEKANNLNQAWYKITQLNPDASYMEIEALFEEFTQQNIDTIKMIENSLERFSKSLVEGQNVAYSFLGNISNEVSKGIEKHGHLFENGQRYTIESVNNLLGDPKYTLVPELLGIHKQIKSSFSIISDFLDDFDGKVVPTLSSELFNQPDRFYVAEIQSDFSQKAKAVQHALDSKYATPRSGDYRSPYSSTDSGNDLYYTEKGLDPYVDSFAKNWQIKVVQQAVLKGIEKGKNEILFPSPKTAQKVQNWPDGYEKDPKYKALYDTYNNIQKTIQKATGIKPTKFTDEAGNEWWLIKVDPKQSYEFPDFKYGGKIRLRKK